MTENRILRRRITGRVRLTDGERRTLAAIGNQLGKQALAEVATVLKPDTILAWHPQLVAKKFDGSQKRRSPGRPTINAQLEALVVRLAQENRSWGYDRIVGALAHLGYTVSDQTVGNILKRHGIPPIPERKKTTTWKEFIGMHMDVVVATDFFTTEVWTWCGAGDVGRSFLHPDSYQGGAYRRGDTASRQAVDEADRAQRHNGRVGFPVVRTVFDLRRRRQVLPHVSADHRCGGSETGTFAGAEPQSERLRRAVGEISEGRSPVAADPV